MSNLLPSQWTSATNQDNNLLSVGGSTYWVENAYQSYSLTNPSSDNTTLRFELHPGDHFSGQGWTDPAGSERDEIAGTTHYANGTNIHVSYDFEVEQGAANAAPYYCILGQMHDGSANSPPLYISLGSPSGGVSGAGEHLSISVNEGGKFTTLWVDPNNFVRGVDHQFEFNVRFDPSGAGHLDFSIDGVQVVNYNGALGASDGDGYVYWKEGIYRSAASNAMAVDYSNLSITTGDTPSAPSGGTSGTVSNGGSTNDVLVGQDGVDNHLFGGAGNDQITGGTGFNIINGNTGDDTVVGKSQVGDWLMGGQGNDSIDATASTGHNVINGNLGADTIHAGAGGDTIRGGQGDDLIVGGGGNDWISGDRGTNTLTGGHGAETFHAGAVGGTDYVTNFDASKGDHIQLDAGVQYHLSDQSDGMHIVYDNGEGGQMILEGIHQQTFQNSWIIQ